MSERGGWFKKLMGGDSLDEESLLARLEQTTLALEEKTVEANALQEEVEVSRVRVRALAEQAQAQEAVIDALEQDRVEREARLTDLEQKAADATKSFENEAAQHKRTASHLAAVKRRADKSAAQDAARKAKIEETKRAYEAARKETDTVRQELESLRADLAEARKELAESEGRLVEAEDKTRDLQAAAEAECDSANEKLRAALTSEAALRDELAAIKETQAKNEAHAALQDRVHTALARSHEDLQRRYKELEQQEKALEGEIASAREEGARVVAQLDHARARADETEATSRTDALRWASLVGHFWDALEGALGSAAGVALESALSRRPLLAEATSVDGVEAAAQALLDSFTPRGVFDKLSAEKSTDALSVSLELGPALADAANEPRWTAYVATQCIAGLIGKSIRTTKVQGQGASWTAQMVWRAATRESKGGGGASPARSGK